MLSRHGAQGIQDEASHATLENEFGTHNEDECLIKILEGGTLQEVEVSTFCFIALFHHLSLYRDLVCWPTVVMLSGLFCLDEDTMMLILRILFLWLLVCITPGAKER